MPPRGTRALARRRKAWEGSVGHEPYLVWYGERPDKNYRVYLRWRVPTPDGERATNWRWRSLKLTVRDAAGVLDPVQAAHVVAEATALFRVLSGDAAPGKAIPQALSLIETWPIVSAETTGSLPAKSPYRDEIERALTFARKILGDGFLWVDLTYEQLQRVVRAKADAVLKETKKPGLRAAEVVGVRLLTLAGLLRRKHDRIPPHAPIPSGRGWREDLQKYVAYKQGGELPDVQRPRHSLDEVRKLLAIAPTIDPRLDLLLQLGAEYRSGQVVRAMRSDLDLTTNEFGVRGRGKKQGTTVVLTAGQQAAVARALAGYLAPLEQAFVAGTIPDYPLFPAGRMRKGQTFLDRHATAGPMHKRSIRALFHEAEKAAEITPVAGRAFYGLRRQLLDAAADENISDEGMQEHGAWSNSRTPRDIYRDRVRKKARQEAATVRAKIRGEPPVSEPSEPAAPASPEAPSPDPTTATERHP